jgi:glyoxylase-like metal-dependent hydrolase (beta-lactamase superfamily II)
MATVTQDLYASAPTALPFAPSLDIRAFLLTREAGNLLVYTAPAIVDEADAIEALGGIAWQYVNHSHEDGFGVEAIADRFGSVVVDQTFSERTSVDRDFEVIPTPGHTPDASAFLWDSGHHRYLFTGDTISLDDGEWVPALLGSSDRESYIVSLELIRELNFDLLVPWVATHGQPFMSSTNRIETRRRIDAIVEKLERA